MPASHHVYFGPGGARCAVAQHTRHEPLAAPKHVPDSMDSLRLHLRNHCIAEPVAGAVSHDSCIKRRGADRLDLVLSL